MKPNLAYGITLEEYRDLEPHLTRPLTDEPIGAR